MPMINLRKNEKALLIACVLLAAAAVIYGAIIEPVALRIRTLDEGIRAKTSILIKTRRLLQMRDPLQDEYLKYRDAFGSGGNEEDELARSLGEIENISKKSACRIENVKPYVSKKAGKNKEISFEVTAEGSIGEISRFLYGIETSKKCLRVRRFAITPKPGSQDGLRGTFQISKIIIY